MPALLEPSFSSSLGRFDAASKQTDRPHIQSQLHLSGSIRSLIHEKQRPLATINTKGWCKVLWLACRSSGHVWALSIQCKAVYTFCFHCTCRYTDLLTQSIFIYKCTISQFWHACRCSLYDMCRHRYSMCRMCKVCIACINVQALLVQYGLIDWPLLTCFMLADVNQCYNNICITKHLFNWSL